MNKKGFTLVELMAVIVIIALISTIAVVSMRSIQRNSELKLIQSNFDLMLAAGNTYGEDHLSKLTSTHSLYISVLKTYTALSLDNEYNDFTIKVYKKNNRAYSCVEKEVDKLHNLGLADSEIDTLEKYFCKKDESSSTNPPVVIPPNNGGGSINVGGTSATFEPGSKVNNILQIIMSGNTPNDDGKYSLSYCAKNESCHYTADNAEVAIYNVSSSTTMSIYLYGTDEGNIYLSSDAETLYLNEDSSSMFKGLVSLEDISALSMVNTSKVTNMSYMFYNSGIKSITSLSNWDVSKVTNMTSIFESTKLTSLIGLENWHTDSLIYLDSAFANLFNVLSLEPIQDWNVKNVKGLNQTFLNMRSVNSLGPLRNWEELGKNQSTIDIGGIFQNMSNIDTLEPISGWLYTDKFTKYSSYSNSSGNYNGAFQGMSNLDETGVNYISNWRIKVIDRYYNSNDPYSHTYCKNGKTTQFENMFKDTVPPTTMYIYDREVTATKIMYLNNGFRINNGTVEFTKDDYCHGY